MNLYMDVETRVHEFLDCKRASSFPSSRPGLNADVVRWLMETQRHQKALSIWTASWPRPASVMCERSFFALGFGSRCRRDSDRVVFAVTGRAVPIAERIANRSQQSFLAQVTKAVGADEPGDLFDRKIRGNQLFLRRSVHSEKA